MKFGGLIIFASLFVPSLGVAFDAEKEYQEIKAFSSGALKTKDLKEFKKRWEKFVEGRNYSMEEIAALNDLACENNGEGRMMVYNLAFKNFGGLDSREKAEKVQRLLDAAKTECTRNRYLDDFEMAAKNHGMPNELWNRNAEVAWRRYELGRKTGFLARKAVNDFVKMSREHELLLDRIQSLPEEFRESILQGLLHNGRIVGKKPVIEYIVKESEKGGDPSVEATGLLARLYLVKYKKNWRKPILRKAILKYLNNQFRNRRGAVGILMGSKEWEDFRGKVVGWYESPSFEEQDRIAREDGGVLFESYLFKQAKKAYKAGRYEEALGMAEASTSYKTIRGKVHYLIGGCLLKMNFKDDALYHFRKAHKLEPNQTGLKKYLEKHGY